MDNHTLAERLRKHARELEVEGGNLYRVRAYRRAAETISELNEPVVGLLERGGRRGLQQLPGIGSHIALALESFIRTGELPPPVKLPAA